MNRISLFIAFLALSLLGYAQCPAPINLYVSATTVSSATIGWTTGGSSTWQVEYGLIGFNQGNGTMITTTSNPLTINNLPGATTFHAYVRDTCTNGSKSTWAGPLTFNTGCIGVSEAPVNLNFETSNWVVPPTFNTLGTLGACWVASPTSGFVFTVGPPAFSTTNTGPSGDHTTGNGKFIGTDNVNFGTNLDASIRSPRIDLSTITNPEISFWYHMFGSNITSLKLEVRDANSTGWTTMWIKNGQQQNASTDNWKQAIVSLSSFANDTIFIRFKAARNSTFGQFCEMGVDDLIIQTGPTCPKPSNLTVNSKTSSSVTVGWTTGGATNWQIEYGLTGFTQGNGTLINPVTTNPYTITGLSASTTYDIYVRDSCGSNDLSAWLGPLTTSTECNASMAPFSENFDAQPWVKPVSWNQVGTVDPCWKRSATTEYYWDTGPPAFPNNFTGPPGDHTTGNGQYLMTETQSFWSGTRNANLKTPLIDLSPLTVPELTFWYHMFGSGIGTLRVQIDTGNGWINLQTLTGQQQTVKTAPWLESVIDLTPYANKTVQFRFLSILNSFSTLSEIGVDDFDIHEQPSCPKPQSLAVNSVSNNSATLSWTTGGASNWILKYSSGTPMYQAVGSNPGTITGLSPNTTYQAWVRDSCGNNDVSDWIGPVQFRTDCNPVSTPFFENFESSDWEEGLGFNDPGEINDCWSRTDTTGYYWNPFSGPTPIFNSGPDVDHTLGTSTGKYIFTRRLGLANNVNTELITPWIDLAGLTAPELEFYFHMFGSDISFLRVFVTRINGTKTLETTITGQQQTSSTAAWIKKVVNLTSYVGDTVKISFRGVRSTNGFFCDIAIDDVSVDDAVCLDPTNIVVSNVTNNSVDVSWTSSNSTSNIQYGPSGFTPGNGTWVFNVTSPSTLTGLTAFTGYDIYVKDSCSANNTSNWVGPVSFTTDCDSLHAGYIFSTSGLLANFDSSPSLGTNLSYSWDFGDGQSDTSASPGHLYATSGNYTVQLIVTDACGNSDTVSMNVQVCIKPVATFTFVKNGLNVSFDGTGSSSASTYDWDFGDGNFGTGGTTSHTYAATGPVTVTLIVTNLCGETDTVSATFDICNKPTAYFEYRVIQSNSQGMLVDFDGTGSIGASSFLWLFGDGNSNNTTSTPSHLYKVPGLHYNVSLIVFSACGDSDTMTIKMSDVFGLEEWVESGMVLYPNPSSAGVNLQGVLFDEELSYSWFDLSGKYISLEKEENAFGEVSFDLTALPAGTYILIVSDGVEQRAVRVTRE